MTSSLRSWGAALGAPALSLTLLACDRPNGNTPAAPVAPTKSEAPAGPDTPVPSAKTPPATDDKPAPAKDGFPTGQQSAEGAACDLARSFIDADGESFRRLCLATDDKAGEYKKFIDQMVTDMASAKSMPAGAAGGPKAITRVFRSRALTANGPGSFGYAAMRLADVRFVDVECQMWGSGQFMNRTLVAQREDDELWYVMPRPDLFPLLSAGLNDESESTEAWTPQAP